jgi:hypothetical protein
MQDKSKKNIEKKEQNTFSDINVLGSQSYGTLLFEQIGETSNKVSPYLCDMSKNSVEGALDCVKIYDNNKKLKAIRVIIADNKPLVSSKIRLRVK